MPPNHPELEASMLTRKEVPLIETWEDLHQKRSAMKLASRNITERYVLAHLFVARTLFRKRYPGWMTCGAY